jgi:hypothetical protein
MCIGPHSDKVTSQDLGTRFIRPQLLWQLLLYRLALKAWQFIRAVHAFAAQDVENGAVS